MPKVNWKKRNAGVLGRKPHIYHRHWTFLFTAKQNNGSQAFLDNDDLEECPYKNQIKIVGGSVLLYIGEWDTSVHADLYLPSQVTMVIIHKFGVKQAFCFTKVAGGQQCSVYPGSELKCNPHAK